MPDTNTPSSPEEAGHKEFPTYRRGRWWPAFALFILPFVGLLKFFYKTVKDELNWLALIGTIGLFETFMLFAEHYSLKRGHWVFNESRILGPKIFGIPIEEPLLYYCFPAFFVIVTMLAIRKKLKRGNIT